MLTFLTGFLAFFSEYLDSALGMGYGTALAPALIIAGYHPLKVVPAILLSQFVTDIATCFLHHRASNVDLNVSSKDFKIAATLGVISCVGVVAASFAALHIPARVLTIYIGLLVSSIGILLFFQGNKCAAFSWKKIASLSFLAAFNKGISGGGYGPLVMGGQILCGVNTKNAVGITAFAEALTCLVGFLIYLCVGRNNIDWKLIGILTACALPSIPLATATVKNIPTLRLKKFVSILITILGILTLTKK